jgi:hypothetical protein
VSYSLEDEGFGVDRSLFLVERVPNKWLELHLWRSCSGMERIDLAALLNDWEGTGHDRLSGGRIGFFDETKLVILLVFGFIGRINSEHITHVRQWLLIRIKFFHKNLAFLNELLARSSKTG